jgi:hypothetical protein
MARRLAWTFTSVGGTAITGFPDASAEAVHTVAGTQPLPPGSLVQLLHPVLAGAPELAALRALAARLGISQPVRQLWRETFQLSDAERRTGLYSDRYAGHILRFGPFYGLARRRGWGGGFLATGYDGGDASLARRDYASAGLRASWAVSGLEELTGDPGTELCLTGRLTFSPLGDVDRPPVPLAEVPAEIFSEAMRDLDLCVSMTTVANDPAWVEGHLGDPFLDRYWESAAGAGLDQLRNNRREVLAPHFQGLADSGRFELTDRDLIVRGSLATYRIDLATANVRTEPAGKWLSFDTRLSGGGQYQHEILGVPSLDDDEILKRILIRAAILADDEQLASRKLLQQIRG